MKPILEMNDEELYEFYLDKKCDDSHTIIDDMKKCRFVGRNKEGCFSDYECDDVDADTRFENDALIFKLKENEEDDE